MGDMKFSCCYVAVILLLPPTNLSHGAFCCTMFDQTMLFVCCSLVVLALILIYVC